MGGSKALQGSGEHRDGADAGEIRERSRKESAFPVVLQLLRCCSPRDGREPITATRCVFGKWLTRAARRRPRLYSSSIRRNSSDVAGCSEHVRYQFTRSIRHSNAASELEGS